MYTTHFVAVYLFYFFFFFFQAEDGIRDVAVTGVQTCALPISRNRGRLPSSRCIESARTHRARAGALPLRASDTTLRLLGKSTRFHLAGLRVNQDRPIDLTLPELFPSCLRPSM